MIKPHYLDISVNILNNIIITCLEVLSQLTNVKIAKSDVVTRVQTRDLI